MSNASRDANYVPTIIGVSSVDLATPTLVAVNPSTGAMLIDGTSLYASLDTRYLMQDGSKALSANWDAGSFEIRAQTFESDVATGTAPLVIASTTKVTNLNADLLDDQSGSYYLDSANFTGTNWTDLTDSGATILHKHSHTNLDDIGTNTHAQIDTFIGTTVPGTYANQALSNLASVAINTSLISDTDSTDDLGSSTKYWANAYIDKIYLNSTATLDGATAGRIVLTGELKLTVFSNTAENATNVTPIYIQGAVNQAAPVFVIHAGASGQSGNMFEIQDSSGGIMNLVTTDGRLSLRYIGAQAATLAIATSYDAYRGIIIKSNSATQSANLQEWWDHNNNVIISASPAGDIDVTGVFKVDGVQVISNRVVDARADDVINTGDATSDGVLDAVRDCLISHGLLAAA